MDWNNDGLDDFILGDIAGYVNFFQRDGEGICDLQASVHIRTLEEEINVESMAAPACVFTANDGTRTRLDWNEDGLGDLVIGSENFTLTPTLRLYLNSGSNEYPLFTVCSFIEAAGEPIDMGRINPHIVDLDGDGRKDIIAGDHYGSILFFKNTGTNSNPVFAQEEALFSGGQPIDIDVGSKIWPEDMNGDGILDILASDYEGYVYLFPGLPFSSVDNAQTPVNQPSILHLINSPVSNGSIEVSLTIPFTQRFALRILDVFGRVVISRDLGQLEAGVHAQTINIPEVQPGVYFVSITGEHNCCCCKKVTVLN